MPKVETKVCHKEGVEKPLEEFHKDRSTKDGYAASCAECRNRVRRKSRKNKLEETEEQQPVVTEQVRRKETDALTKCHIAAYRQLRQRFPQTFEELLRKEMNKNPILVARKWREMPETEGV